MAEVEERLEKFDFDSSYLTQLWRVETVSVQNYFPFIW